MELKERIENAIQLFDGQEFDVRMLITAVNNDGGKVVNHRSVDNVLRKMVISRRRLSPKETERWRKRHGTKPRMLYREHLGPDPVVYERGHARSRPTVREVEQQWQDDQECAFCPEQEECWEENKGCLRGQAFEPPIDDPQFHTFRKRVYRLDDFDE